MCVPLLWPGNEIIPHIVDIQDYLLLFASLCATKKEAKMTSLERKTGLELKTPVHYISIHYGEISLLLVTPAECLFYALLHFNNVTQR